MGWFIRSERQKSKEEYLREWTTMQPLPQGKKEFEAWSDRIINAANLKCEPGKEQEFRQSQKFALADMIMHLGPNEDHKEDAHFIKYLRKVACNQVAHAIMSEIRDKTKERLCDEEKKAVKLDEPLIPKLNEKPEILADKNLPRN